MSWRVTAGVVLAAFVSVHAQQTQDPVRFPNRDWLQWLPGRGAPRGGVIIGTVVDAETGQGLPRTRVTLTGEGRALPILTDPLGRYYFVALPPGEYRLQAERPGFVPGELGRLRPDGEGHPIALEPDEWRTDGDIRLWRTAVISGFVGNEIGEPVVGVRVQAIRREFVAGAVRLTSVHAESTDDRGEFRISGLTPGSYLVMTPSVQVTVPLSTFDRVVETGSSVSGLGQLLTFGTPEYGRGSLTRALDDLVFDDDTKVRLGGAVATPPPGADGRRFAYPSQYYPSADLPALATPVRIEAGEEFSGISFYLWPQPTWSISGQVLGPDGPVGDQMLRLVPDTGEDFGPGFETAATITAQDGTFEFEAVPRGGYVIDVGDGAAVRALDLTVPPRQQPARGEARDALWAFESVSLSADDIENLIIVMREAPTVEGTVTFEGDRRPAAEQVTRMHASVYPVSAGRPGAVGGQVDERGSFTISGLRPGEYWVVPTATPSGWHVESITGGGRDLTSEPLRVSGGDTVVVAVRLTDRGAGLWGTVRDQRGFVVPTATVVAFPADGNALPPLRTSTARTNRSGVFRLSGLPPGTYRVAAIAEADAGDWQERSRLSAIRAQATAVLLRPGDVRNQDLRLAPRR